MNKFQRNLWLVATVSFAVCLVVLALSYIVTTPWHMLPDIGGDGAKNNYTYLYHCMYGKGYWFDGMNYPYGEHIVFTDGQPLLSVLLAILGNTGPGTALTVCWWLLGLSYVLSIVFIYKTLTHFRVSPFRAMVFAGIIGIFTPQILCLRGHYALAYTCVIPMIFYWTICYNASPKFRYCAYVFIMGSLAAFLHPYYVAIMLVWSCAYAMGYVVFTKARFVEKLKHALPLPAAMIGVLLLVAVVMKLTDPIKDRPVTPFNPMEANVHIKQIFSSSFSPVWEQIDKAGTLPWKSSDGGEGYTYLGIVCWVTVLVFLFVALFRKIKKKPAIAAYASRGFSLIWLFVAFASLILAMGIPFIWNMQWLMNYISVFKQFRALGRFSWIFYYVITIYSVVVIDVVYEQLLSAGKKIVAYAVVVLAIGIWGYELSGYIAYSRELARMGSYYYELIFSEREQNWESFLGEHKFKKGDFQAILVLNFYHIGSEKLWVGDGAWSNTLATRAALEFQLPIIDVMMSRTSWSLTKKQVKLVGGPFTDKPMLRDIKSNKPFLLLHYNEDSLDADQQYLLEASDYLGPFSQCKIYACYPERILANDRKCAAEINNALPYVAVGDTCIAGSGSWLVQHYDDGKATDVLFGAGAAPNIKSADSIIAILPVAPATDSQYYELSAWFLLGDKDPRSPYAEAELLDSAGNMLFSKTMNAKQSLDNYNMWFRASVYFRVPAQCRKIRCKLVNTPYPLYLAMDELMLRPATSVIVSKATDGSVMVNNHIFKKAK